MMRAVKNLAVDDIVVMGRDGVLHTDRPRRIIRISASEAHAGCYGMTFADGGGIVLLGEDLVEVTVDLLGFKLT